MMNFIRKHVGLKIAVLTVSATLVVDILAGLVLRQMNMSLPAQNLLGVFTLFSLFFFFFQLVLIVLLVNLFITRPLQRLYHGMQKVEAGNLLVECESESSDEFGEMSTSFNKMVKGLREMNETRKRIEQRLIKTEESLKYKVALEEKAKIIERMNSELTDAFNNVALLYTVSQYLNSVLDVKELSQSVQKIFEERFKCDQYALYFLNSPEDDLLLSCHKGFQVKNAADTHIRIGEGIAGKVAEHARTFYYEDVHKAVLDDVGPAELEKQIQGAVFSLPLQVRGTLIGVLSVVRATDVGFTPTDRQSLYSIASQIAVAYDRCKLYTRTKELAVRDELTGIYNRRHFQQMLELEFKRAERYKRHISLLMIDVDHFKKFNDTFGHLKGDELLKQMAKLLRKNLREIDVLARYGGEEFVVMLADTSLSDGINVANKLRELVKNQLKSEAMPALVAAGPAPQPFSISISVGVSAFPECATTPEELLNSADMALYVAKRNGRNQVYAYQVGELPVEELISKMGIIH